MCSRARASRIQRANERQSRTVRGWYGIGDEFGHQRLFLAPHGIERQEPRLAPQAFEELGVPFVGQAHWCFANEQSLAVEPRERPSRRRTVPAPAGCPGTVEAEQVQPARLARRIGCPGGQIPAIRTEQAEAASVSRKLRQDRNPLAMTEFEGHAVGTGRTEPDERARHQSSRLDRGVRRRPAPYQREARANHESEYGENGHRTEKPGDRPARRCCRLGGGSEKSLVGFPARRERGTAVLAMHGVSEQQPLRLRRAIAPACDERCSVGAGRDPPCTGALPGFQHQRMELLLVDSAYVSEVRQRGAVEVEREHEVGQIAG